MRESNCPTKFLDHTQKPVGDRNQFLAKITKPPPSKSTKKQTSAERNQFIAEITKPPSAEITISNHVLASTGTGIHKSVKQCKSLRCREAKPPPREAPWTPSQTPPGAAKAQKGLLRQTLLPMASGLPSENHPQGPTNPIGSRKSIPGNLPRGQLYPPTTAAFTLFIPNSIC